jgi:hypothetical protein
MWMAGLSPVVVGKWDILDPGGPRGGDIFFVFGGSGVLGVDQSNSFIFEP